MEYYIYTTHKPDIHKTLRLYDTKSQCYHIATAIIMIVAMYFTDLNLYGKLKDNCKRLKLKSNKTLNVH